MFFSLLEQYPAQNNLHATETFGVASFAPISPIPSVIGLLLLNILFYIGVMPINNLVIASSEQ